MNKKTHQQPDIAISLQYDGKNAPRVTAKGEDEIARQIRALAKEHDIPLYEDVVLAQVLAQIDLGDEIPRSLYVTVAQVIAFSYLMAGRISPLPQQAQHSKAPAALLNAPGRNAQDEPDKH